jgi:serine/threonine protein kinase
VNKNCDLKICEFGLARSGASDEHGNNMIAQFISSRWYRAPEIMLSWKGYSKAGDIFGKKTSQDS